MKRTSVVVLIVAVVLMGTLVLLWISANAAVQRTMRREWPANLGAVEGVPLQYPPQQQNAAATRLIALVQPLGIELTPWRSRCSRGRRRSRK